jgi:hypothetical protein
LVGPAGGGGAAFSVSKRFLAELKALTTRKTQKARMKKLRQMVMKLP